MSQSQYRPIEALDLSRMGRIKCDIDKRDFQQQGMINYLKEIVRNGNKQRGIAMLSNELKDALEFCRR